jgi:hypothetical protein
LWAFLQYCEGGKLYRFLQEKTGLSHLTKQDFKSEYFFESFYGRNYSAQKVWCVIKEEFPTVAEYISWSKRKGQLFKTKRDRKTGKLKEVDCSHAMLPRKAQEVEADFIIDRCCGRLQKEHPELFVATIHDSIVTTYGDGGTVKAVMTEEFAKLDVSPKLKIERL